MAVRSCLLCTDYSKNYLSFRALKYRLLRVREAIAKVCILPGRYTGTFYCNVEWLNGSHINNRMNNGDVYMYHTCGT